MQYCHACGCKLSLGTEKFCPECGQNLLTQRKNEEANRIGTSDTKGDVIGVGITGTGHFIGKEIGYTVNGNVINLNISGNVSNEKLDSLKKIINAPLQIDQKFLTTIDSAYNKDIHNKLEETNKTQKQIASILQEVNNIEKKEGTEPIEIIKTEDIQISKKDLLIKEHILKGNEYYYRKQYDEALQYYNKAIELDANDGEAWYNKGTALYQLGKHNEAIQCFDKFIEMDPNNANITLAWYNKGTVLSNLGKHNESIQCYEKALEIDANNSNALNNKGLDLAQLGKYDEALQCFDKSLEIDVNNSNSWLNKGFSLYNLGKHNQAIQCYDKALEIDANDVDAWYNKGLALYNLGKYDEALQCFDKSLEIDPNDEYFIKNRNITLKKLRETEKSRWKKFFGR